jgi:uncharacterized membrane protein
MQRLRGVLSGVSLLAYPLLVHVFVVQGSAQAALLLLIATSSGFFLLQLALRQHGGSPLLLALYGLLAGAAVLSLALGRLYALFFPPVIFNLAFAVLFGLTLRAGQTSLIERFMRLQYREHMTPALARYGRQLTWLWLGVFVFIATTSVALAVWAPLTVWSYFANILGYLIVGALFVGQFVYSHLRFRVLPPSQHLHAIWAFLRSREARTLMLGGGRV